MYCKFTAKIKNKQENDGGKWRENRLKSNKSISYAHTLVKI